MKTFPFALSAASGSAVQMQTRFGRLRAIQQVHGGSIRDAQAIWYQQESQQSIFYVCLGKCRAITCSAGSRVL
jgi:hypothetical protein